MYLDKKPNQTRSLSSRRSSYFHPKNSGGGEREKKFGKD
jgi:hypothetical protein